MPGSREDDFYRKNANPLYDLYGHDLVQGVMEVTVLVDPSLVLITDLCLGVEKKVF